MCAHGSTTIDGQEIGANVVVLSRGSKTNDAFLSDDFRWEWSPEAQMMLGKLVIWTGALLVSRTQAVLTGEDEKCSPSQCRERGVGGDGRNGRFRSTLGPSWPFIRIEPVCVLGYTNTKLVHGQAFGF